ncbi:MAG: ribonuclease HI family protein [bacterium]|nr:ribonuclease HI family protein [bacterium]MDZ4284904.1 ribonuclease HI family protein [Patescibacteria group bacterium]
MQEKFLNEKRARITVFTDGGARGNPGPAGAGVYIVGTDGKPLRSIAQFLGRQTNNWAEYQAVILALEALKKLFSKVRLREIDVELKLDSELVARQLRGEYQIKEPTLFPQYIRVHNLRVSDIPNFIITHVPRAHNKDADRLANEAMDRGA